jgi:hypothetical protein
VLRVPFPVLGGLLALTVSLSAEAAVTSYVDSSQAFDGNRFLLSTAGRVDLGEVSTRVVGPRGVGTSFDTIGDRVNILGALDTGTDTFEFDLDVPAVRVELRHILFEIDGNLEITVDSSKLSEKSLFLYFGNPGMITRDSFAGITSMTLDNTDTNNQLIGYELELVATPLPGALVLFGTGLAGIAGYRRWFKPTA